MDKESTGSRKNMRMGVEGSSFPLPNAFPMTSGTSL